MVAPVWCAGPGNGRGLFGWTVDPLTRCRQVASLAIDPDLSAFFRGLGTGLAVPQPRTVTWPAGGNTAGGWHTGRNSQAGIPFPRFAMGRSGALKHLTMCLPSI